MRALLLLGLLATSGCSAFFERAGEHLVIGGSRAVGDPDPEVARLVRSVGAQIAAVTREELDPALRQVVRDLVTEAVDAASDPARVARTEDIAAGLAERVTRAVTSSLADGSRADVGPALRAVLEREVGPALAGITRSDVGPALAGVVRDELGPATGEVLEAHVRPVVGAIARDMARGMTDEVAASLEEGGRLDRALARQRALVRDDLSGSVDQTVDKVDAFTQRALGGLGVGAAGLAALALVGGWAWWRARRDAAAYEQTVTLLTSTIQRHAGEQSVDDLIAALRGLDRTAAGPAALDRFLDERPWLKVPKGQG